MYESYQVIGRLGNDPEMRYTSGGDAVCSFSLAIDKSYKDKNGDKHEKVKWVRVTAWRKLAEVTTQYLSKGSLCMVVGEVNEPNVWTDKDGNQRANIEVTAREVKFLGGGQQNQNGQAQQAQASQSQQPEGRDYWSNEDIPF
eukprot:GHVU01100808.1.p3 GENE.GHVU01100808.1~~GHVU01100808.1.p3  ORF type:complete len:142 (+),score=15.49 GHVU01100808.1:1149-1574(+)